MKVPASKETILEFLVNIAQNRGSPLYSSAFVGGVMTLEEITQVNDSRALNSAIEKLSPGSIEAGAVLHVKQILKMCLKLNGRDCDKYLHTVLPGLIKYLDIGLDLCSKQATICEEMNMLLGETRRSQSDLQVSERTLSTALSAFADYSSNPSKKEKCNITINALTEAIEHAQDEQELLLTRAIELSQKVCALYSTTELSPAAQYCMDVYELWMDIITPFIYPFKNTTSNDNFLPKQELINKMLQHKPTMVRLAFHLHDLQLYTLHRFDRPLASFACQICELGNKRKKKIMVSMYSFTHRPVGNGLSPGPQ